MYHLKDFLLVGLLLLGTASIGNSQTLGDLPADVVSDILSILIDGTVHLIGDCTGSDNSAPETNYWIYTNDNPNNPTVVTQPSVAMCGGRTRIIFISHGWSWDANVPYIIGLKDAYLSKYNDACIISVNWGVYALKNYQSAYCAAPGVASNLANFICSMVSTLNVNIQKLHLVGHSMSAQIMGIAGSLIQTQCGKIERITGLDPAGPLYTGTAVQNRLDPTDATFVDVIHTNQGQYGYLGSCGHLDAFPNCGFFQPGCLQMVLTNADLQNPAGLLNLPLDLISCNHRRSVLYFQESINSNQFIGTQCLGCGLPLPVCTRSLFSSERKVIGEACTTPGLVRNYLLYTRSTSPYALG